MAGLPTGYLSYPFATWPEHKTDVIMGGRGFSQKMQRYPDEGRRIIEINAEALGSADSAFITFLNALNGTAGTFGLNLHDYWPDLFADETKNYEIVNDAPIKQVFGTKNFNRYDIPTIQIREAF